MGDNSTYIDIFVYIVLKIKKIAGMHSRRARIEEYVLVEAFTRM